MRDIPVCRDLYVQYGCGPCAPVNWRNFDASPTLQLQKLPLVGRVFRSHFVAERGYLVFTPNVEYGNIVRGLPVKSGACNAIYCSHVLEHLTLEDARVALRHSYDYLAPDGIFRFVLPDLEHLAKRYLESSDVGASIWFMEHSGLGRSTRNRGIEGCLREWLGNSSHLWMWDFRSLSFELEQVGFRNIRRAEFSDSREPRFADVEDIGRWSNCVGVECFR